MDSSTTTTFGQPLDILPSERTANTLLVVCTITGILALIAVVLRIYTKYRYVKIRWDDRLMVLSLVFFLVYCTSASITGKIVERRPGVTLRNYEVAVDFLNVAEVFYTCTITTLKISLGIFFLRIAQTQIQRRIVIIAVIANTLFGTALLFFVIFQCGYYKDGLEFLIKRVTNQCASDATTLGLNYTHALVTTATDWTFLLLPSWILKQSMMHPREKLTIGFLLAFASLSGIASIIRLPYIAHFAGDKTTFFATIHSLAIWSCLEPGIGIICGSIVTLRPLVRKVTESIRKNRSSRLDSGEAGLPSFVTPPGASGKHGGKGPGHYHKHVIYQNYNQSPETMHQHDFVCKHCQQPAEMTTLPASRMGPVGFRAHSNSDQKKTRGPRKLGRLFNPLKSKDGIPGFGLRLFGSSFGKSTGESTLGKSTLQSLDSYKSQDALNEKYFKQGTALPRPRDSASQQDLPFAQTLGRGVCQPHRTSTRRTRHSSRAGRSRDQARSTTCSQGYIRDSVISPTYSSRSQKFSPISPSVASSQPLRSPVSPAELRSKPLPPPPASAANSVYDSRPTSRSVFSFQMETRREPSLPLYIFSEPEESDDDSSLSRTARDSSPWARTAP